MEKTALSKSGKMLASDFDRTFYVNCKITEANTRAVETWRQQGNLFVIATGREESILREKLEEWEAEADYLTDYLLEQYGMPVDVTCKSFRKQVITGTDPEKDPIMYNGIRETITQEDFRKACREVLQVHVRFSNNEETCKAAEVINARYPGAEAFVNENNADIVSRGLGKAEGIAILTKAISFRGQIAAIGDAHNDLGMLRRYQGCTLQAANPAIRQEIPVSRTFADVAACLTYLSTN